MYEIAYADIFNIKGTENIFNHMEGYIHDVKINPSRTPYICTDECGPTRAEFENAVLTEDERNNEAFMNKWRQSAIFRDDPPANKRPPEEEAESESSNENNNNTIYRTTQQINDRSSCTECLKQIPTLSPICHGCGTPVGQSISTISVQPNNPHKNNNDSLTVASSREASASPGCRAALRSPAARSPVASPTTQSNEGNPPKGGPPQKGNKHSDGRLRVTSSSFPSYGQEGEVDEVQPKETAEKRKESK
jgi:hypothetical protein